MTAEKILEIARREIGVTEYPARSNNVKYNTEYYGREVYGDDAYPWCMVFVWWVFRAAGASKLFYDGYGTASCPTLARWAQANNLWVTDGYKPGDVLIYNFDKGDAWPYEHTGILEKIEGSTYYAIEGNTSLSDDDNGGAVMRRMRNKTQIIGAFRPMYKKEEVEMTNEEVKKLIREEVTAAAKELERATYDYVDEKTAEEPFYAEIDDVPDYWREDIRRLVEAGIIQGDGEHTVGLTRSATKAAILAKRMTEAPKTI